MRVIYEMLMCLNQISLHSTSIDTSLEILFGQKQALVLLKVAFVCPMSTTMLKGTVQRKKVQIRAELLPY